MNIYLEIGKNKRLADNNTPLDGDVKIIFDTIYLFIEERLSVLKEEIDAQLHRFIIFKFTPNAKIEFHGFTDSLTEKMKECITEEDLRYIVTKAYYLINMQ